MLFIAFHSDGQLKWPLIDLPNWKPVPWPTAIMSGICTFSLFLWDLLYSIKAKSKFHCSIYKEKSYNHPYQEMSILFLVNSLSVLIKFSVGLPVCLSVCLAVCLSVSSTLETLFLKIFSIFFSPYRTSNQRCFSAKQL